MRTQKFASYSRYPRFLVPSSLFLFCLGMVACIQNIPFPSEVANEPPSVCALPPGAEVPSKLSQTGLFSDLPSLTPIDGFHEYGVIAPLWSDGARKRRWMFLPKNAKIGFSATDPWTFPEGTCFIKHFDLDLDPNAAGGRIVRVETRVLIKRSGDWIGYTYKWTDDQTDADLLNDGVVKTYEIIDPRASGGVREQPWNFPSRTNCLFCHNANAGGALGVRTMQINREFAYQNGAQNQLSHWNEQGLFDRNLGDLATLGAYTNPSDTAKPLAARARSYLASNCAHCHQPGGPTGLHLDLRYATPIDQTGALDAAPTAGDLGIAGARLIANGHKETSVLWLRMMSTDRNRMPFIGSNVVDPVGTGTVGDWIDSLISQ